MAKQKKARRRESASAIVKAKAQSITVAEGVEDVLIKGDLTPLTAEQRLSYYNAVCKSLGLNPLTRPFGYIAFRATENSPAKLVLYALKDCTEQLRKIRRISCMNVTRSIEDGLCISEVDVVDGQGRRDHGTGVVPIHGMQGKDLANAIMKSETKGKRRATLSICGLGFLDESELDTVDDYGFVTPQGRIAFPDVPKTGSREAAQAVLAEKLAGYREGHPVEEKSSHIEPDKAKPATPLGILEVDWEQESSPKLFGDLGQVLEVLKKHVTLTTGDDGFYHILPKDVETIRQFCVTANYELIEHMPKTSSPVSAMSPGRPAKKEGETRTAQSPVTPSAGLIMRCRIQVIANKMTQGTPGKRAATPYLSVLCKMDDGDKWASVFDRDLFEHITKGKGKEAEFYYKSPSNEKYGPTITGIVHIGGKEFVDGKLPAIQVNREAGGQTLFGGDK